jgi:hypothetical protein
MKSYFKTSHHLLHLSNHRSASRPVRTEKEKTDDQASDDYKIKKAFELLDRFIETRKVVIMEIFR